MILGDAMEKKASFIIYLDYEEHFSFLTDKEIGVLMRGIFQYVRTGEVPDFKKSKTLNMAFSFIKTNIDIDNQKYQKKCEKNKQIAEDRWKRQREKQEQQEQQFKGCHLGSLFKNDSCFKCQKKYICNLPESPDFKLSHDTTFTEWNKKIEELYKSWCEERQKKGESTDIDIFLDYDWLNDSESEES